MQCYDEAVVSYRQSRDILKSPRVSFEPLRRLDGFVHLILRHGRLFGHWRVAPDTKAIEIRLADDPSSAEQEVLGLRIDALHQFLTG